VLRIKENFLDRLFSAKSVAWPGKSPAISRDELMEIVAVGGYPPAVARQSTARRDAWFQSYIATTLQRDIRDLSNIADITAVPRLLSIVASRAGSLLNFADLSRTMAVPQTTLKRYFRCWKEHSWCNYCVPGREIWANG
jgi:predicted AAA+ superfamily ATPase